MPPRISPGQATLPSRWASRNTCSIPGLTRNRTRLIVVMTWFLDSPCRAAGSRATAHRRGRGASGVRVSGRVVEHALKIDDDGGLVADHPGVVAARQKRYVARPAVELAAIVHSDPQDASDVILEMRRLAA